MHTRFHFAARADARSRVTYALAAALCLSLSMAAVYSLARAQAGASQPAPALVTDTFSGVVTDPAKPPANITAYRTGNLSAGDAFSGVVTSDATDPSQLTGLVYQVVEKNPSGTQTVVSQAPVSNGVYKGLIPAAAVVGGGVLIGELLKDGKQVGTATPVPVETQPTETTKPPLTSDSYTIPSLMQAGKPTAITFKGGDGDLTTTHVTVGGQPVQELAEGPTDTVFRSPSGVTGPTTVQISKNGVTGSGQSRNVAVSLSAVSKSLATGTQEELTGKVSGLMALDKPLTLDLQNNTPAVQLQGGNTQKVTIAPTDVQADGSYTFERDIAAEHPGSFNITATLEGLSIPGPGMATTPGGPVIAGGGANEGKSCDNCTANSISGPWDGPKTKTCTAESVCANNNKSLQDFANGDRCKKYNTGTCTGDCPGITTVNDCHGYEKPGASHGVTVDGAVDGADSLNCKAKKQVTCEFQLHIAEGGLLACTCGCR